MFGELGDRIGVTTMHRAEQIFRLVLELIQVGNDGQPLPRHTSLLEVPVVRRSGEGGS